MATKKQLPKLADLHNDVNQAFKNDELNLLLNQPVNEGWLKKHPSATVKNDKGESVKAKYLPIDKVEFMLTYIFQLWRVEIKEVKLVLNSVLAIVRLHYLNPITGEWSYHDGVGAVAIQLNQGAAASDLTQLKSPGVQMAAPSAVSYAIKDAAEHLGALFGRDMNRRDVVEFTGAYGNEAQPKTEQQQARQEIQQTLQGVNTDVQQPKIETKPKSSLQNIEL